jgi:hypothetical protein
VTVGSRAVAAGGLGDPAGGGRLGPRWHDINGCWSRFGPTCLDLAATIFFILKNGSFVSAQNSQYLKVVIFSMIGINNMFTADTLDPFCSSDRLTAGD